MNKRVAKQIIKKSNKSILICFLLFLLIGIISGYFINKELTKKDTFEIIGDKNITINLNEEYIEVGARAISYGKDLKDKIEIESNVDITKEGRYVVTYSVKDSFKYKNIIRVRYVTVISNGD